MAAPQAALTFDIPVMIAVALAYLLLDATGHDALPAFSGVLGLFVLPLTPVTLLVLVGRVAGVQGFPWQPNRAPRGD